MSKTSGEGPLYRRIIKDAWRIAWGHKHLWLFGFFATFAGVGGVAEVLFGIYDRTAEFLPAAVQGANPLLAVPGMTTVRALVLLSENPVMSVIVFSTISLLFVAAFVWVVIVAVGALIAGIRKVEKGGEPTFAEGLKEGGVSFVNVLVITAVSKFLIATTFLLTGANLAQLLADRSFTSGFFYVTSYVIFTAIALVISVLTIFAVIDAVVNGARFDGAARDGWKILKDNWIVSMEMALILFVANVVIAIVTLFAAGIIAVPFVFLFMLAAALQAPALLSLLLGIGAVVLIAGMVVVTSFITTFQLAAWMLLWKELGGGKTHSRIVLWGEKLLSRLS